MERVREIKVPAPNRGEHGPDAPCSPAGSRCDGQRRGVRRPGGGVSRVAPVLIEQRGDLREHATATASRRIARVYVSPPVMYRVRTRLPLLTRWRRRRAVTHVLATFRLDRFELRELVRREH